MIFELSFSEASRVFPILLPPFSRDQLLPIDVGLLRGLFHNTDDRIPIGEDLDEAMQYANPVDVHLHKESVRNQTTPSQKKK